MNIRTKTSLGFLCCLVLTVLFSCKEHIDTSNRYVFKERTIASYLSEHAQFSEYVKLLKTQKVSKLSETSVYQLMTAYGAYTCFAPTNEALQLYLELTIIISINFLLAIVDTIKRWAGNIDVASLNQWLPMVIEEG